MSGRLANSEESFITRFWFTGVLNAAGVTNASQLKKKLDLERVDRKARLNEAQIRINSALVSVSHYERYQTGEYLPADLLVNLFDEKYPGTKVLFTHGFKDSDGIVPVWHAFFGDTGLLWDFLEDGSVELARARLEAASHQVQVKALLQTLCWDINDRMVVEHALTFREFTALIAMLRACLQTQDNDIICGIIQVLNRTLIPKLFEPFGLGYEAKQRVNGIFDDYDNRLIHKVLNLALRDPG